MAPDVVRVQHYRGTTLDWTFADRTQRRIDIAQVARPEGVFENVQDPAFVASATICEDIGTICWPSGADLSPELLFESGILLKQGSVSAA